MSLPPTEWKRERMCKRCVLRSFKIQSINYEKTLASDSEESDIKFLTFILLNISILILLHYVQYLC